MENNQNWAQAIALRITDELHTKEEFPEDVDVLREVLEKLLSENEWAVNKLISTGIIEEAYFEPLN